MHMRLAGLAVTALAAVAFAASPATRVYRDARFGFIVTYPKSFRVVRYDYFERASVDGTAFGDVAHPERYARYPFPNPVGRGVVMLVEHIAGGPPPIYPVAGHDSTLPLARASFSPDIKPRSLYTFFVGNGWSLSVRLGIGRYAAKADTDALWKMVRSIRMVPLRTGETTGDAHYLVAGQAASYAIVSVTKVGSAFLVHAPGGFYALAQQQRPRCDLTFTLPVAFSCPDGRRWDRMGRPQRSGTSPNDALLFAPTDVAHDGHVLVAQAYLEGANTDDVEKQLWG